MNFLQRAEALKTKLEISFNEKRFHSKEPNEAFEFSMGAKALIEKFGYTSYKIQVFPKDNLVSLLYYNSNKISKDVKAVIAAIGSKQLQVSKHFVSLANVVETYPEFSRTIAFNKNAISLDIAIGNELDTQPENDCGYTEFVFKLAIKPMSEKVEQTETKAVKTGIRRPRYTEAEKAEMSYLYNVERLPIQEIANRFGCSTGMVYTACKDYPVSANSVAQTARTVSK